MSHCTGFRQRVTALIPLDRHGELRLPSFSPRSLVTRSAPTGHVHVSGEVGFHLALRFHDETQAQPAAGSPAIQPMPKAPAYQSGLSRLGHRPGRQSVLGPGQVVGFFTAGRFESERATPASRAVIACAL